MGDIGGKGHLAQGVQHFLKDPLVFKFHQTAALLDCLQNLGSETTVPEDQPGPRTALLPRLHQSFPHIPLLAL
jgi:hypothetical protein